MAVGRRLRFEILRRDGHACRYCGAKAPDVALTVDHVIPVALGGGDEPANLVTACADCNSGKASVSADAEVVEDVDATAMLFAQALEEAAERRRADASYMDGVASEFLEVWARLNEGSGGNLYLPDDWDQSVRRFVALGLDWPDLERFVSRANRSRAARWERFSYFCGCCWREISDRQELARRLIEDGEV